MTQVDDNLTVVRCCFAVALLFELPLDLSVEFVKTSHDALEGESVYVCIKVSGLNKEMVVGVATKELVGEAKGE